MTDEERALAEIVVRLEALSIPYMVAGSFASSFHGRPRTTQDADVVIDPTPAALDQLVQILEAAGFYVDRSRARDALARRRAFNVVELRSAFKVDLIIRKQRPFSAEEFRRRMRARLAGGTEVALATPEDTVLSKLEWAKQAGGSERQILDASGVVAVCRDIDRAYVARWAKELDVLDLWLRIAPG